MDAAKATPAINAGTAMSRRGNGSLGLRDRMKLVNGSHPPVRFPAMCISVIYVDRDSFGFIWQRARSDHRAFVENSVRGQPVELLRVHGLGQSFQNIHHAGAVAAGDPPVE